MIDVAALWEAEYPAVCGYFRRRLGADWEMADDLASEVFVRVWAKRDTYHERAGISVRAWLYRIAHNLLVDYWRTRRPTMHLGALRESSYALRLDRIEERAEVREALDGLPVKQRAVLIGRFYEGRQQRELHAISSLGGVKKLQERALVNLRRALEAA